MSGPPPVGPSALRSVLYLSPYFPPQSRVGALRPLKFARHLPNQGWRPVVLCDLWQGAQVDLDLLAAVPPETVVVRDWTARAQPAWRRLQADPPPERQPGRVRSVASAARWQRHLPTWLNNPELVPLGEHGPRMWRNLRAARRTLDRWPCEAILVNADPYAACLVGAQLAEERGLPLILDLRDPWAPCELRRPRRPRPVRALVDRLERWAVERAAAVVLNTETAQADYRRHYADLDPDRFHCIRNHYDRGLISAGAPMTFDRFSLLFLGNFGRFIKADVLLRALAALRRRGVPPGALQLVVTGRFPAQSWRMAQGLGVQDMVTLRPHVPYRQVGATMHAADALLLLIQPRGEQRFAAKFFDYLASPRPMVAVSDNRELRRVMAETGAGVTIAHGDDAGLVDALWALWQAGRQQVQPRTSDALSTQAATARLAALLDRVS